MATIKNGINGPVSGKIGNVVGSSWRGINILRSVPKAPTHFSDKQLANQLRMKLAQLFLKQFIPVVRIGFKDDTIIPTAFNSALSFNKKNAIAGEYPNLYLDYAAVKLSQGPLYIPEAIQIAEDDAGLHFSWDNEIGLNGERDDQLLVITWNEAKQISDY